jgi:hypothetical protein
MTPAAADAGPSSYAVILRAREGAGRRTGTIAALQQEGKGDFGMVRPR